MNQEFPALQGPQLVTVALARFRDHTELLRSLTQIDLRILGGYMTVQLVFAAWVSEHFPETLGASIGFIVIDTVFVAVAIKLFYNNFRRRKEVVATLKNVCDFLRFNEVGAYLPDKALDSATKFRPWFGWYLLGIGAMWAGVMVVLSSSPVFLGG